MIPTRRADRRVLFWAYLAIPVQYLWIGMDWYGMFLVFIPVYMFLFLAMRTVLIQETEGFLKAVGTLHWGSDGLGLCSEPRGLAGVAETHQRRSMAAGWACC